MEDSEFMKKYSQYTLATVGELIELAFGDSNRNVVHHKTIQAILFILANQLRILKRQVFVDLNEIEIQQHDSTLSVTEVTVHAKVKTDMNTVDRKDNGKQFALRKSETKLKRDSFDESNLEMIHDKKLNRRSSITRPSGIKSEKHFEDPSHYVPYKEPETIPDHLKYTINAKVYFTTTKKSIKKTKKEGYQRSINLPQEQARLLDEFELKREQELRSINQAPDSREDQRKSLTPMKSMDSIEAKYEKMIVVERVTTGEAKLRANQSGTRRSDTSLSIVTQEQFQELAKVVNQIQQAFGIVHDKPNFPENLQLMQELRRGASLTDAMSALQLSARLEATEKTIGNLVSIVTTMATKFGIDVEDDKTWNIIFERPSTAEKFEADFKQVKNKKGGVNVEEEKTFPIGNLKSVTRTNKPTSEDEILPADEYSDKFNDVVYASELDAALSQLYDTIKKEVDEKVKRNTANTDSALKLIKRLEARLDSSQSAGDKMTEVLATVSSYAYRINHIDKTLTAQMTEFQEELTQMQHDLESAMENMADALANTTSDVTVIAELNSHFNGLQDSIEASILKQEKLKEMQRRMADDFVGIREQIEALRATKCDREEVEDALRDKAGIEQLNGLVDLGQFEAIRGDYQNQISIAYEKFNSQEMVWQKIIDDFEKALNDKADHIQLMFLKEQVNDHLEQLNKKIKCLMDIVGEPSAAAVTKMIYRDAACLSCSAPAHLTLEQITLPKLRAVRPPALGAEKEEPEEDGKCYPGYPIPHPIDPRVRVCRRWCGGAHTIMKNVDRAPPGPIVTTLQRYSRETDINGKIYTVETSTERKPCSHCALNIVSNDKRKSFPKSQDVEDKQFDITPPDFNTSFIRVASDSFSMNAPIFDD